MRQYVPDPINGRERGVLQQSRAKLRRAVVETRTAQKLDEFERPFGRQSEGPSAFQGYVMRTAPLKFPARMLTQIRAMGKGRATRSGLSAGLWPFVELAINLRTPSTIRA